MNIAHFKLRDGRKLAYRQYGIINGEPVFYFHGAPSSSAEAAMIDQELLTKHKVCIIAPDRPGCGGSDPQRNRTFSDWADDVQELADHLNLNKFSVIGNSCGGAYVAACCLRLEHQIKAAVILAGAWRMDHPVSRKHLTFPYSTFWSSVKNAPIFLPGIISSIYYSIPVTHSLMPYPDNKVLRNGRLKGFKDGVSGAMKNKFAASWDLMMYTRKFDFSVESVKFPILLLHGERDKNVPVELVRFISGKLINSTLITFKSEAHFSILANQFEKALLHIKSS